MNGGMVKINKKLVFMGTHHIVLGTLGHFGEASDPFEPTRIQQAIDMYQGRLLLNGGGLNVVPQRFHISKEY